MRRDIDRTDEHGTGRMMRSCSMLCFILPFSNTKHGFFSLVQIVLKAAARDIGGRGLDLGEGSDGGQTEDMVTGAVTATWHRTGRGAGGREEEVGGRAGGEHRVS